MIKDEGEFLRGIQEFCQNLYARDPQIALNLTVRNEILSLIDKFFTKKDNQVLKVILREEEINKIVFEFPKEKSPRSNGVTHELIQDSWEFVKEGCIAMVQAFRIDALLTANMVNGIIKMVPKGNEMMEYLDN